jgi:hypothetical protein
LALASTNAQRGATPSGHALLLGTQRTGTTWAMAELDRSPCVSTTSELFIQFKWERGARMACLRMLYGDADARDRSLRQKCSAKFRAFLDKSRQFALKNNATGFPSIEAFKWMQSVEKDWDWLKELWKRHDVKVITLRRRDHVRTLLSRITNRNTGLAHPSQKQAQVLASKKVRLRTEPKVLLRHLRIIERSYQQLGRFHEKIQKAGISAKMVYYEDLVSDPQALDRLRTFALGDAAHNPRCQATTTSDTVYRIHAKSLAQEISNYNQVKAALRHTKYSKFIDADEAQTRAVLKPQALKPQQPRYDASARERSADEEKKRIAQIEAQTAKVLAREERKDQEYVSSFLAQLRAKAIESMHALLEAEADDDDA